MGLFSAKNPAPFRWDFGNSWRENAVGGQKLAFSGGRRRPPDRMFGFLPGARAFQPEIGACWRAEPTYSRGRPRRRRIAHEVRERLPHPSHLANRVAGGGSSLANE